MRIYPLRLEFNLDFKSLSIAQLLTQWHTLTGLVYLQDNHSPIIACLPQDYWYIQGEIAYYYQRQDNLSYICQKSIDIKQAYQEILTWQNINIDEIEHTLSSLTGFTGGYIGFVSYDDGANFNLKQPIQKRAQPSLYLGCYRSYIKIEQDKVIFYSDEVQGEMIYHDLNDKLQKIIDTMPFQLNQAMQARWTKAQYQTAFQRVQDYIVAGDCYQINLTQEFHGETSHYLLAIAERLWQKTQAPFAGYLKLNDFELLSCSPELFIEWQTAKHIKTRPIKGTLPRHHEPIIDAQYRQQLQHSTKDQAENLMIVDLLRNDLSIYAELGSVKTTKLFEVESFNQVHHLVSEIQAILKPIHPYQVLMMALPGGSITGAPKIRAMQIIDELEQNARGIYCGSLGYFNFDGTGRWNILIRSIQKYQQHLSVWAGGGITIASQCEAEYQECYDKIQAILDILNQGNIDVD